jgi:cytochrome c
MKPGKRRSRQMAGPLLALAALLLAAACGGGGGSPDVRQVAGGDAGHGKQLIQKYGCGACHDIPGIGGAKGYVGPPLIKFSRRSYVAGVLQNTPENLMRWLEHPQQVVPNNDMPEMGISEADARDIAAYLYSLK